MAALQPTQAHQQLRCRRPQALQALQLEPEMTELTTKLTQCEEHLQRVFDELPDVSQHMVDAAQVRVTDRPRRCTQAKGLAPQGQRPRHANETMLPCSHSPVHQAMARAAARGRMGILVAAEPRPTPLRRCRLPPLPLRHT